MSKRFFVLFDDEYWEQTEDAVKPYKEKDGGYKPNVIVAETKEEIPPGAITFEKQGRRPAHERTIEGPPDTSTSNAKKLDKAGAASANSTSTFSLPKPADVRRGGDVIMEKERKPEWKEGSIKCIPKFDCVTEHIMTIDAWCDCVERLMNYYSGAEIDKMQTLKDIVPLPDFKAPEFDLTQYKLDTFLKFIRETWKLTVGDGKVEPVLKKDPGQTWMEFRLALIHWARSKGLTTSDDWILAQMKANIEFGRDMVLDPKASSDTWARTMDRIAGAYASPNSNATETRNKVAAITEDDNSDEEEVAVIGEERKRFKRKPRLFIQRNGKPNKTTIICFKCHKPGHIARDCPRNKNNRNHYYFKKSRVTHVYVIEEGGVLPMMITVRIRNKTMHAMVDSGAAVNVIDEEALRRIMPRANLKRCDKKLEGANHRRIAVVGMLRVAMNLQGKTTPIELIVVKRLSTDLILGGPGLRDLGLQADFVTRTIYRDKEVINTLTEIEPKTREKSTMEVDIDKNLSPKRQDQLRAITTKWANTLVETIQDRGPAKGYKFSINTGDTKPIYVPLRTYSPREQEELDKQIEEMLSKHIITRIKSPWSAPVLLVKKKDNTYRVVVDYTRLNEKTEDDPYPLPIPRTAFQELNRANFYSSLDLASGYWQVEVAKKDIPKTAFNTRKGTFAYLRMPMGLKGAPSAFQRFMTDIFSDLLYRGVLVFIDDILIYSESWEEHLKLVDEVLKRLSQHNLQAKVGKCHFGAREVKYLGSIVSHGCRKPDPDKVKAIKELESPKSKDDIRSVLGLVGFYREFIPNLASLVEPIQRLMKKDAQFKWGPEQQEAFDKMKEYISEKSCLEFPERDWAYELHTDASLSGIGAVLFQRDPQGHLHTIEFASKSLSKAQRKQAIPVLECYAIVWALKKFRCYIHGVHVDIYTDHFGLQFMKRKKNPPAQMQRWWWDIADYDFTIIYKKGKENIADPLSRLMPQSELDKEDENDNELIAAINYIFRKNCKAKEIKKRRTVGNKREYYVLWSDGQNEEWDWESRHSIGNDKLVDDFDRDWENQLRQEQQEKMEALRRDFSGEKVISAQKADPDCEAIRRALAGEKVAQYVKNDAAQCVIIGDILYHKDNRRKSLDGQLQLVIPKIYKQIIMEEVHGGMLAGHFGIGRTLDAMKRHYWWHGMKKDVEEFVRGCPECNARNPKRGETKPLLQPEERTAIPWERVGIDYTDIAKTQAKNGYCKILVMIDHATKYVIAKATKDGSAETAARILFEELICKYGAPKELWSDRGKSFIGEVVSYLARLFNIKQKFTSGYHPQTNGLTERFNRTIIAELAKSVNVDKDDWPTQLQAKIFAYNTTQQKATGYAPCELLFTFMPRTPLENELIPPPAKFKNADWAKRMYETAEEMREDALKRQQAAAESQKKTYNRRLKPTVFKVGDYVRVLDTTAEASKPVKLRNQWIGPFRIRGMKGMLFVLENLNGTKLRGLYNPIKLKEVNAELRRGQGSDEIVDAAEATSEGGEM